MGIVEEFEQARTDRKLAVIEGFHALKHAVRFGANLRLLVTSDLPMLRSLCESLAPDVADYMLYLVQEIGDDLLARIATPPPRTKIVGVAERNSTQVLPVLEKRGASPIIFLSSPRDPGNVGAAIRVAAAGKADGVAVSGVIDPWQKSVVRGAAGLQYALPVGKVSEYDVLKSPRPIVAIDPDGEEISLTSLPMDSVLAFGTERDGLQDDFVTRATHVVRIPMRGGVSSLNLATSVAVVLYLVTTHT